MAYISVKKVVNKRVKKSGFEIEVKRVIIPAFLTALSVAIVVYLLVSFGFDIKYGSGSSLIVFASLGSSAFIMFMTPKSKAAKSSKFAKSYLLAGIIGYISYLIAVYMGVYIGFFIGVFIMSILMYLLKAEHPPAVGIVLVFVMFKIGILGIVLIVASVMFLLLIKYLFNRTLSKFILFD